ncbi:MAG: pyridoxamine 5'-phosphate oxidase family protein [Acidimicrobiia bacterium]
MALDPNALPDEVLAFLTERHLGTLATTREDGGLHAVAIGFTYDPAERLVRMITFGTSQKVRNARRPGARAAVGQVDGPRWVSLEGPVRVSDDPARVAAAVDAFAARYRPPSENPLRVALEIEVERIMGRG